jgi:hypothetical protein
MSWAWRMSDRDATGLARLQIVTFDNDEIEQSTSVMEEMDSVVGLNPFWVLIDSEHVRFALLRLPDHLTDNLVNCDAFGFGMESGDETVSKGRVRKGFDVIDSDVRATLKKCTDFPSEYEHLTGAWACAPAQHALDILGGIGLVWASGADEIEHEIDDMIWHRHFPCKLLGGLEVFSGDDCLDFLRIRAGGASDDATFIVSAGVVHFDQEEKAVLLRFRERIGAFLLDGILRRQHKKRLGKIKGLLTNCDMLLLHRFKKSGLCLGRCAVNFVS